MSVTTLEASCSLLFINLTVQVAIKKLKESSDTVASAEMQRELDMMLNLRHENIVTLKGIWNESPEVSWTSKEIRFA
jgi:hypothetical protein